MFKWLNSYDIPVDILNIPNKGINNKSVRDIRKIYIKLISLRIKKTI